MADDLLGALRAHCRRRPLDQPQRERIRLHMQACGIAAISDGELVSSATAPPSRSSRSRSARAAISPSFSHHNRRRRP